MFNRKTRSGMTEMMQKILECDLLLDVQEKVSIVFLMCDDAVLARSILTDLEPTKILPDLFSNLNTIDNHNIDEKVVESLILIKNYKLVGMLGFSSYEIDEMKIKYRLIESKHNINLVRKALLKMCEKMSVEELAELIYSVKQDFIEGKCHFNCYDSKHMELNLLYWICEGYISDGTKRRECDVGNLIMHLQKLNKCDLAKDLQSVYESVLIELEHCQPLLMGKDNDQMEKSHNLEVTTKHIIHADGDTYIMDKDNMGLCIIVNQRNFSKEQMLKKDVRFEPLRYGTDYDRDMLNITFSGLGYNVLVLENLGSNCLRKSIRNIVRQEVLSKHSSLVLCILSHGKLGAVYGIDGIEVPVEEIENMILGGECPQLLGKPKILLLQSCQGTDIQTAQHCKLDEHGKGVGEEESGMLECDGPTKSVDSPKIPPTADLITFFATVPGYAAFRFHNSGSVFIQNLCEQLLKCGESDFNDIVISVNDQLSKKQFGSDSKVVMSQVRHTIRKKLYFPYSSKHRYKGAEMLYFKYLVEYLIKECIGILALYRLKMK